MALEIILNWREMGRVKELFDEGYSCEEIAMGCMDDDREDLTPCRQTIRKYLARQGIWPLHTKRIFLDCDEYGRPIPGTNLPRQTGGRLGKPL